MGKGASTCERQTLELDPTSSITQGFPWEAMASILKRPAPEERLAHSELMAIKNNFINPQEWDNLHRYQEGDLEVRPVTVDDQAFQLGRGNLAIFHKDIEIGYAERSFLVDDLGHIYLPPGRLRLKPEYQQAGFGVNFMRHTEQLYKELGVHRFEISAIEIGAYAWAREGFHFLPHLGYEARDREWDKESIRRQLAKEAAKLDLENYPRLDELVKEGKVTPELAKKFSSKFSKAGARGAFYDPIQIANFGKEASWEEDGKRLWLGKAMLTWRYRALGRDAWEYPAHWSGVKFYNP